MGAFNVVSGSWGAIATGTIAVAHGITGVPAVTDGFVAVLACTSNVLTATTPPNATNIFVSRTATTSGSVMTLVGLGVEQAPHRCSESDWGFHQSRDYRAGLL